MQHRNQLPNLLNSLNLKDKGAEVGVFKGEFSKFILENWNGHLYMIDTWKPFPKKEYEDGSNKDEFKSIISEVFDNLEGYETRSTLIRSLSHEASELFEDYSLDFVYIDANHTYNYVKSDIESWYKKVKIGGILCGHDYINKLDCFNEENYKNGIKNFPIYLHTEDGGSCYAGMFGVNPAVDEFCKSHRYDLNITNEFLATWWIIKR